MNRRSRTNSGGQLPAWLTMDVRLRDGPFVIAWQVSRLMPRPEGGVAQAGHMGLGSRAAGWTPFAAEPGGGKFINVHPLFTDRDGLVYLAHRLNVAKAGVWKLSLGHDGGARLFVDGDSVLTEPRQLNPACPARSCARVKLSRGIHEVVVALDLAAGMAWGFFFQARKASADPEPVVIGDLSGCKPRKALGSSFRKGRWRLLPFTTPTLSGTGLCALTHTGAPTVMLALHVRGWHAVYLGLGGSGMGPETGNAIKVKLTGDAAYQHRASTHGGNEEVLFKVADVTGRSLEIAQQSAGYPQAACLYYVKLVPLSIREVNAVRRDRAQRRTQRLVGTIDGHSLFYMRHPKTKAEVLEEFEPFRDTDFGTLWWGISGADLVNYRSKLGTVAGALTKDYPGGSGYESFTNSVQTLIGRGIDVTRLAVEACHAMGIRIHISMRPAAWKGPHPYDETFLSKFYVAHPEWRCRDIDGTSVTRMSFAVPEVRQHLLGIFRETLEAEPDGLNMLYNRGVPLILWEDAFCDRFRTLHGEDARQVPEDDPRIYELRMAIMTQWMCELRRLLDDFRKACGRTRRLALSAMCLETEDDNRRYGLDVARWVREGLVDQIGIYRGACHASGKPIDVAYYRRITAGSRVTFHPNMAGRYPWEAPTADEALKQAVEWYDAGVDRFMFWDGNHATDGLLWPIISRLGHEAEVRARAAAGTPEPVSAFIRTAGDEPFSRWSPWAGF